MLLKRLIPLVAFISGFAFAPWAHSEDKLAPSEQPAARQGSFGKFLRVVRADGEPVAMETSISRYVPKEPGREGLVVELISAVHIGEASYYTKLNKLFESFDAVLYELVAPEGTRVPKGGGKPRGVISGLQNGMKDMLDLEFQLNEVDYTPDNFVHADMSPEAFAKAMADRGESIWSMMFRLMGQAMAQQAAGKNAPNDLEILMALFDQNRSLKLKRILAGQFENLEFVTAALSGPDGSALIEGRNQAALTVLKKQIEAGKTKVAIFYGAGHMPDIEKRLIADFGLKHDGERWVEAWNLRDPVGAGEKKSK
ncbi:MAG: hypothetical protein WD894_04710 [Pirellulales bacterium]